MAKIKSLTFSYDGHFTIAADEKGRTYRVLMASGRAAAFFYLSPWATDNSRPAWHGHHIDAGHPLLAAIEEAEQNRPRPAVDLSRCNFAADEI